MTHENFCYWLQGFFEIQNPTILNPRQVQEIKNHLDLTFNKVTPKVPESFAITGRIPTPWPPNGLGGPLIC